MTKEECFEYFGITKFWKAGYTGKNVRIMSGEKIIENYYDTERWKKVICPVGYQNSNDKWHGSAVMFILQDVCPDATYYAYPFNGTFTSNSYKCNCADYIIENNIHLFTTSSVGGKVNVGKGKALQKCIDNGTTFFACAGNEGEEGLLEEPKSDKYIAIGAIDDNLKWLHYSSVGQELDYVSIAIYGIGTSYTTPTFVGMCGLVQDFFIDKTGRALNRTELIKFIDDNLVDIEEEGFDVKTGKGLFILPEPSTIDIAKYVPEYLGKAQDEEKAQDKAQDNEEEGKMMYKICLDAGHGIDTAGKRSPDSSLLEYEFNRDVASRLKAILEAHGVEVVLTCINDIDASLSERCRIANNAKADYFVSIHANAYGETWNDANGWEIYVVSKGGKAEELAQRIHKYSIADLGLKDRGIKIANFQVLRDTDMPAMLIEHGFYTNKEECEKLKDSSFRQKCAIADAKGILEQLGIEYKEGKDINVATKLVLTIDSKEYTVNGQVKQLDVAPKIENGRTLVPIYLLRELNIKVEWNENTKEVSIWK